MGDRNFCAGIHVLVKRGNKYLVLKLSGGDEDEPNTWDLPGGGIKFGEQPIEALMREAKEEAGIRIKVLKILSLWAIPYKGKWSIEALVEGEYLSGEIKLSEEHSDYKWISRKELEKIRPKSDNLKALFKYWL